MNILIVEDDLVLGIQLEESIEGLGYPTPKIANNYQDAEKLIETEYFDLVILDIELGEGKNGLDLAEKLAPLNIPFIVLTSHVSEIYYEQAKQYKNTLFLQKPANAFTLDSAVKLLQSQSRSTTQFIRDGLRGAVVAIDEIIFIQVEGNYTNVQTATRRHAFRQSLVAFKKRLPSKDFIQVHGNYIVQKKYIKQINTDKNQIVLENHTLPLSRRMKKEINTIF
jgi:DNA-binding LytR/AlgR family response regulator